MRIVYEIALFYGLFFLTSKVTDCTRLGMRRILVTGANKGIGFAIAKKLLKDFDNTFVIIGSRDISKGSEAVSLLEAESFGWKDRIHLLPLDCSIQESVNGAAEAIRRLYVGEESPLFGIVNNAGIGFGYDILTTMETNLYGVKRVTDAFLPLISKTDGRIVNVGSGSAPMYVAKCSSDRVAFFKNPDVTWPEIDSLIEECISLEPGGSSAFTSKGLGNGQAYGLSKACLNLYTMLVARENPSLIVNSCSPGFINTDLVKAMAQAAGQSPAEMGAKDDIDAGAVTPVYLMMGEVEGRGWYYGSDGQRSPLDRYRSPGDPPYTEN